MDKIRIQVSITSRTLWMLLKTIFLSAILIITAPLLVICHIAQNFDPPWQKLFSVCIQYSTHLTIQMAKAAHNIEDISQYLDRHCNFM